MLLRLKGIVQIMKLLNGMKIILYMIEDYIGEITKIFWEKIDCLIARIAYLFQPQKENLEIT